MGFSGVHGVYRINGLTGSRIALSTCVYRRGSLVGSLSPRRKHGSTACCGGDNQLRGAPECAKLQPEKPRRRVLAEVAPENPSYGTYPRGRIENR